MPPRSLPLVVVAGTVIDIVPLRYWLTAFTARAAACFAVAVLVGCGGQFGCGGQSAAPAKQPPASPRHAPRSDVADLATGMPAVRVATLPGGTLGPYLAMGNDVSVAIWAAADAAPQAPAASQDVADAPAGADAGNTSVTSIGWYARALPMGGAPKAVEEMPDAIRLADAPRSLELVSVRSARQVTEGHFVVSAAAEPNAVHLMVLGPRGELRGGPSVVAEPAEPTIWVGAVPLQEGGLVFWATDGGGSASIFARRVAADGRAQGAATTVFQGVRAWQIAPFRTGAAVAVVLAPQPGQARTELRLRYLDGAAKLSGDAVTVRNGTALEPDLDMIAQGGGLVVAWSERSALDTRVHRARITPEGKLVDVAPLTPPIGEQVLLRLVPPAAGSTDAYVAWETPGHHASVERNIHVGRLDADARLRPERGIVTLQGPTGTLPELEASSTGLTVLTQAMACALPDPGAATRRDPDAQLDANGGDRAGRCSARPVPTYVAFDDGLWVKQSQPLKLAAFDGRAPNYAWDLECRGSRCFALAGSASVPAPVYRVELRSTATLYEPAARRVDAKTLPNVAELDALFDSDVLADVAAAKTERGALVATLTYFDPSTPYERPKKPAPDGRFAPVRAVVETRVVNGDKVSASDVISYRARSLGGVALAATLNGSGALLAWAALDNQKPQLFATLLDANGKRRAQRMLTRAGGEVSEIAAASVAGGYIVAWVDERHGDPEVYVVRLDGALRAVGGERRITESPGTASDLSLLPAGDSVLLAFSDARKNAENGSGDVYVVTLASKDAAPLGPARLLHEAPGHAHSIRLADYGAANADRAANGNVAGPGAAVVAWIETEGPLTDPQTSSVVRVGALDAEGRFVEPPSSVRLGPGAPSGLSAICARRRCSVVAGGSQGGQSRLVGFVWESGRAVEPRPLASLRGPPGQNIAMDAVADVLFFTDQRTAKSSRVHALTVKWR